ncbi:enoyl-CoA hydratase [Micromonospora pallida]|uniref:Enoyl-CoA hydratase n=1 Tax=Micromonospora pallida TaxID=145854 RepID=A0A1C6RT02_9ACTN|nr:enoyl-CoA hydratase-related protein [Micromonospora pallida]SCL20195.1 enoyl-CoA hydratase [Micromonospora pallida]
MPRFITTHTAGRIGYLTFNRPEKLNAMNNQLLDEFSAEIAALGANPDISVIVISGNGRAFSVGFDVDPGNGGSDAASGLESYLDWESLRRNIQRWLAVWDTPKPVVSAIEGYCMGGATMLAVCTDITVVGEDAVIGWPAIPLGGGLLSPTTAWLIGPKKAKELSFIAGSRMSGAEAAALGWANYAVPAGTALKRAEALAQQIAKMPLDLLRLKKMALNRHMDQRGFREAILQGAEWDAVAHTAQGTHTMTQKIKELGLKGAIGWFHSEENA